MRTQLDLRVLNIRPALVDLRTIGGTGLAASCWVRMFPRLFGSSDARRLWCSMVQDYRQAMAGNSLGFQLALGSSL